MNLQLLKEFINEIILLEKRKKKKRPGRKEYYTGTKKSNSEMAYEIDKCSKKPTPKSCYNYWSADKSYDKSKKRKK